MACKTAQHCAPHMPGLDRGASRATLIVLLVALLTAGIGSSDAADTQLRSARGEVIGSVSSRSTSFDADANMVGAYGVLSARGYFADVLPSGALGQVLSLVYASADCGGAPAIEQASVVGGPLPVPGYVFAFGAPLQIFNVPATASMRELEVGSERQRSRSGYTCVATRKRARVYPLVANRAELSGFADGYAGPVHVQVTSTAPAQSDATGSAPRHGPLTVPDESAAGADVPPDSPECAPGCYMSYLGDHICESECANSLCGFDAGDCSAAYIERAKKHEAAMCAPTCDEASLGDSFCDSACNVSSCNFDQGDCKRK